MTATQTQHEVVSKEEWLKARLAHLADEKEFPRKRDELSRRRRELPWERVGKPYMFEGPNGHRSLGDLFGSRPQLIVYHFMFDPAWDEGCKSCSFVADNFAGSIVHLAARNTSFAAISRAPIAKIESFRNRMGWDFPWVSSNASDFNYDFHVTIDEAHPEYNYRPDYLSVPPGERKGPRPGEAPGISVFLRDAGDIYHTYSTYTRGIDLFLNTYNYLDLTPLGRQEYGHAMGWLRHHDKYSEDKHSEAR
jgi:predicted dithiol-disulfide oxidoreductase (DUF899 family)